MSDLEKIAERMIGDEQGRIEYVSGDERRALAKDYLRLVRSDVGISLEEARRLAGIPVIVHPGQDKPVETRSWRSRVWAELSTIRGLFGKAGR